MFLTGSVQQAGGAASYPGVPLIQRLHVDERHFSTGAGHHAVVLTAHDQVDVFPQLPVAVPGSYSGSEPLRYHTVDQNRFGRYLYATDATSLLSMSSSTNGLELGNLCLSPP